MTHALLEKKKILSRVNRIKGQLEAFSTAIESDQDCYQVMQLLASCRGALNGLMGDIVEEHIRDHIIKADNKKIATQGGEEVIAIMKSFWK